MDSPGMPPDMVCHWQTTFANCTPFNAERYDLESVVLGCSVGIPPEQLMVRGLCQELRRRLSVALGRDLNSKENEPWLTKLGKAKYHAHTPGEKFNCRRGRRKRTRRKRNGGENYDIGTSVQGYLAGVEHVEPAVEGYLAGVREEIESQSGSEDPEPPTVPTHG